MRALKAYANAGALSQQDFGSGHIARPEQNQVRQKPVPSKSGDSISLSDEAIEALGNGGASISVMPQDATYDRQGNVMRQLDNLQSELRALSSEYMNVPGAAPVLGRLGSLQSQVTGLRALV